MAALLKELSSIVKQKSSLLKSEAQLWERLASVLESLPVKKEQEPTITNAPAVVSDRPAYGVLRLAEVTRCTGLSRSSIYKLMSEDSFPQAVALGARAVGWMEQDVEQWIRNRAMQRGTRDARR